MRFAVPVTGGMLAQHFGHCEQFMLFDVDEKAKKITNRQSLIPPVHEPGVLPAWLAQQGANAILAGGMGSRAQMLFEQNKITVVVGVMESDPEKAVLKYLEGNLQAGSNVCDH
jgi:ATP-binding protein involved in chromosome partitioning